MKALKTTFLIILLGLFTSCAASRLKVDLQLFTGEIPEVNNNEGLINKKDRLLVKVSQLKDYADTLRSFEENLATALLNNYLAFYVLVNPDDVDTKSRLEGYLDGFIGKLNVLHDNVQFEYRESLNKIDQIDQETSDPLLNSLLPFLKSINYLEAGPQDDPFKEGVMNVWQAQFNSFAETISEYSGDDLSRLDDEKMKAFQLSLKALLNELKTQDSRFKSSGITQRYSDLLQEANTDYAGDVGRFQSSLNTIVQKLVTVDPGKIRTNANAFAGLTTFIRSTDLLFTQIDRLQDPADPIWRELIKKRNEQYWTGNFNKNYFYSQGKSSVVLVRESANSFKIKQAKNDPTVLVENQMQIIRAWGGYVTSLAGSVMNINLDSSDSGTDAAKSESNLNVLKATVNRKAELRTANLELIAQGMLNYKERLSVTTEATKVANLKSELTTTVESYKELLKNISQKNTDDNE